MGQALNLTSNFGTLLNMTTVLDGKQVAESRKKMLIPRIDQVRKQRGFQPCLAVVLVGSDPASQVYVKNKVSACESVGIRSIKYELTQNTTQEQLDQLIQDLNRDPQVDGILVQLPLPKHLNEKRINQIIDPTKDADCFTHSALGKLFLGEPSVLPCTPQGVISILEHFQIPLQGKNAVVVGRSDIVGKPMAQLLLMKDATVTICHSRTINLKGFTKNADIVVVAAGKRAFLGKDDFKQDSVVIDVGIHRDAESGKLYGDVRTDELMGWVRAVTPVPGGVGPMTILTLLENTVTLAEKRIG